MFTNKWSKRLVYIGCKWLVVLVIGSSATITKPAIAIAPEMIKLDSQQVITKTILNNSLKDPNWQLDEKLFYKFVLYNEAMSAGLTYKDYQKLSKIVQCESSWNHKAIGDSGKALSLAQFWSTTFYLFANQANVQLIYEKPEDQLRLLVWAYQNDKMNHWTCARKLGIK